jgi:glycosyltransferase involved in cell wall biosynthesis
MSQKTKNFKIFILIRSLNVGGAERQVTVLSRALHEKGCKVTVGLFYAGGVLEESLRKAGVSICYLNKKGRWDIIGWFFRYLKAIREVNPDVIYSFLPTSNIIARMGQFIVNKPVVWGIRASYMNLESYDWTARVVQGVEKLLSGFVKMVVFNARFSLKYHKDNGYNLKNAIVIPNGIDTTIFKPDSSLKVQIRKQLGIPQEAKVVGMLARVDPMKDYDTYLTAARSLVPNYKNLYFLAAGEGTDTAQWHSVPSRFISLGLWQDIPGLLNALDVMVLSSLGEGFPNVIGEAMACGIPVVATDVGDASYIIDKYGVIVPVSHPEHLISAIKTLLNEAPSKESVRERIVKNFSVSQMVDKTLEALKEASK